MSLGGDTFSALEGRGAKPGLGGGRRAGRLASDPEAPPDTGVPAAVPAGGCLPCEVAGSVELSASASFPGELCLETELALLLAQKDRVEGETEIGERASKG